MKLLFILPIIALSINFNNDDNSFFSNLKKKAKETMAAAKQVTGETFKDIGYAMKDVGSAMKDVAKETGEAFKEIGSAMKDVAKETGGAFKEIGSAMKDAVTQSIDKSYTESKQARKTDRKRIDSRSTFQSQSSYSSYSSSGKPTTKLPHFDKIDVKSALTVIITQGSEESILIEGSDSVIQYVEAKVNFNTLYISLKSFFDLRLTMDLASLRIYVTCVDLSKIECSGSSTIIGNSVFSVKNFGISVSGASDLSMNLIASNINVAVSGSSDVKLSLQSKSVKTAVSGASDLKLDGKASIVSAAVSGSSDVDIKMDSNSVNIAVSGASDAKLSGRTDKLTANVSGSSDLAAYSLTARIADVEVNGASDAKISVTDSLGYVVRGFSDFKFRGNPKIYKAINDDL